jgi:hypothetical protein
MTQIGVNGTATAATFGAGSSNAAGAQIKVTNATVTWAGTFTNSGA